MSRKEFGEVLPWKEVGLGVFLCEVNAVEAGQKVVMVFDGAVMARNCDGREESTGVKVNFVVRGR